MAGSVVPAIAHSRCATYKTAGRPAPSSAPAGRHRERSRDEPSSAEQTPARGKMPVIELLPLTTMLRHHRAWTGLPGSGFVDRFREPGAADDCASEHARYVELNVRLITDVMENLRDTKALPHVDQLSSAGNNCKVGLQRAVPVMAVHDATNLCYSRLLRPLRFLPLLTSSLHAVQVESHSKLPFGSDCIAAFKARARDYHLILVCHRDTQTQRRRRYSKPHHRNCEPSRVIREIEGVARHHTTPHHIHQRQLIQRGSIQFVSNAMARSRRLGAARVDETVGSDTSEHVVATPDSSPLGESVPLPMSYSHEPQLAGPTSVAGPDNASH